MPSGEIDLTCANADRFQAKDFKKLIAAGLPWVWVQVYANPTPGTPEANHLMAAIRHMEAKSLVAGIKASDYNILLRRGKDNKPLHSLLVVCQSKQARTRIVENKGLAYNNGEGTDMTFFVGDVPSYGNAVVFRIQNGPRDPKRVAMLCYRAFEDVILWKENTESSKIPVALGVARDERPEAEARPIKPLPKTRGSKPDATLEKVEPKQPGNRWIVRFRPDPKVFNAGWQLTKGFTEQGGEVRFLTPKFCTACISFSHERHNCGWWNHINALEPKDPSKTRDSAYFLHEWKSCIQLTDAYKAVVAEDEARAKKLASIEDENFYAPLAGPSS